MAGRAERSLLTGRGRAPLGDGQIKAVAQTFLGLDENVPARYRRSGFTRFEVRVEDGVEVGVVLYGADIYPGPDVADPNSALSMKAAVAHEISHYHRWVNRTELPIGVHRHLDEALTSLDAALRFPRDLSAHEISQLIRDAELRLALHKAELAVTEAIEQ